MLTIDGLQYANWNRALFEEMRAGGLDCAHVTIAYHENCAETIRNIAHWNRLFELHGDLITHTGTAAEVRAAAKAGKTGIVFGFQNCSPIEDDYSLVEIFHTLGVRFMQLTYNNQSLLACGCYEEVDSGVTRFGKQVIDEMNRVGMVVDMSHSAEKSTLEAIEYSARPIAISHANPNFFHAAARNKSDDVLKAIAESGGMFGFSLYPHHLNNGTDCTLKDFCEMVARTAELIGTDNIGIGSDLCCGQPPEVLTWMRDGRWRKPATDDAAPPEWPQQPDWFADSRHFPNLAAGLTEIGFSEADVKKIMGENWLNFFAKSFEAE